MHIGQKISQLIDSKGISKTDFAKTIGFTPQGLNNILKRKDVSTHIVNLIINKMGIPVTYFFNDDELPLPTIVSKEEGGKASDLSIVSSKELEDVIAGKWIDHATRKLIERLEAELNEAKEREREHIKTVSYFREQNEKLLAK